MFCQYMIRFPVIWVHETLADPSFPDKRYDRQRRNNFWDPTFLYRSFFSQTEPVIKPKKFWWEKRRTNMLMFKSYLQRICDEHKYVTKINRVRLSIFFFISKRFILNDVMLVLNSLQLNKCVIIFKVLVTLKKNTYFIIVYRIYTVRIEGEPTQYISNG